MPGSSRPSPLQQAFSSRAAARVVTRTGRPPTPTGSPAGGRGAFDLSGVRFHLPALWAFLRPSRCGEGWSLLGWGLPGVCPSPQPLLPRLPSLEAAAFVSRGAGSSIGPSLTPFVLRVNADGKSRCGGRGRGIGSLWVPPAEDRPTPPLGPVPWPSASPVGSLPPRAAALGRRGADGGPPGTPPCAGRASPGRCTMLCGRPRAASAQVWSPQPRSSRKPPALE